MESAKVSRHFTCRSHSGEPIQRVSKELFGENHLFCIECLIEADKTGDANLVTVPKFIEFVANHFSGFSKLTESKAKAPSKLVSFLADEETALLKLQTHIESEKVKVDVAISSIQQTFNQLCAKKKSELYKIFDDQYLHLKSNFSNYRSKLNKYFPSDSSQQEKFDAPTLISMINACQATEDLELYIKHLKDEMLDTKVIPSDPKEQEKELNINLGQFAEALQDQMNNLPVLKVSSELDTTTKDLEKLVKPFFDDFGKIDNLIYELSIGKLVLMESKILKDPRDVEMLRKWISPKGKCQFKLLFQGSRDGFSASKFHQLCDNYTDTVVIVKSKTHNKIFGGYADVTWNATSNYKNSSKTFLFSITEKAKYKIKAGSETYGTYANAGYLVAFGGGHDFMITDQCNTSNSNYSNFGHSYDTGTGSNDNSKLAGAYNFQVEEIECYHLDYDNTAPEETDLLKDSELKQLKEWIAKGKKVELQRIYQGTKDGFDAVNFHEKCDGKGATLTVVKSQGFGKLFGGYTTIPWAQTGNFASDKKAFLFSLTKGKKYSIMNGDCAVMHGAESGPVFGAGYDMFICSNANILAESTTALGLTYACDDPEPTLALAGTPEFMIDEIETFLVKIK